ncbi:MAG: InlB B-repeat-containing protein [bacterium]|nr:InlB B-repeat-containing protein [bacterium]
MKNVIILLTLFFLITSCEKSATTQPEEEVEVSVSYNGNGNTDGTVPIDGDKYKNGNSAITLGNTGNLLKTNFSFVGWNTAKDVSGKDFLPNSSFAIGKSNINLYAKWVEGNFFLVSYDGNGNTTGSVPTLALGSVPTLAPGSVPTIALGSTYFISSNITFYAVYTTCSSSTSKYYGLNASGQTKSKSTLSSSWISEYLNNMFGSSNLVCAVYK